MFGTARYRVEGNNVTNNFFHLVFDIQPLTRWQKLKRRLRGKCNSFYPRDRYGYGPHLCEEPHGHPLPHGMGPEFKQEDGTVRRHYSEWSP